MENKSSKLVTINTIASLLYQIIQIICGFVVPRLILKTYGSKVNGLIGSVSQFLSVISFLELGIGAVIQSSLYRPLYTNDENTISNIYVSATRFFRMLGKILFVYVVLLITFYPKLVAKEFETGFVISMILILSLNYFAQYYFGIVNRLMLIADQKGYVVYFIQTIIVITNTIACYFLIINNSNIEIVKLVTAVFYIIQPIAFFVYVCKHYNINKNAKYNEEPINQKWNGIAQHFAALVLDNTDILLLTTFSSLSNVSVYSVYSLVLRGIKQLFFSATNGISSYVGRLWAKEDHAALTDYFNWIEWLIHNSVTVIFTITAITIVPFITIYTSEINNQIYIQPFFALFFTIANALYCIRLPYSILVLAAGHFKQTQNSYIIASVINLVVSAISVKKFGLVGVTFGTIVALMFQIVWMEKYVSNEILLRNRKSFYYQMVVDTIIVICIYYLSNLFSITEYNYFNWIIFASSIGLLSLFVFVVVNSFFHKEKIFILLNKFIKK